MARCMLKEKNFRNDYWDEFVSCTTYIINRCPTKSFKNMIPEVAWSRRKHSVTHMRVFGCVPYAHILDDLRKRSDNKGETCIFVGYIGESKAYRFYNPLTKRVIISKHMQFIEEEAWDEILEKTTNVTTSIPQEYKEELVATSNSSLVTPPTPIQAQQNSHQVTPSTSNKKYHRVK